METDAKYSDDRQNPEEIADCHDICQDAATAQPKIRQDAELVQSENDEAPDADCPDIERFANDVDPYVEGRDDLASSHNIELGRKGEQAACRFLERKGYEILERNWNCPFGEADIICSDGDSIHFVEVKTRSGIEKGLPSDAVTPEKRAKYEKIALSYLQNHWECEIRVSFDIISILATGNGRAILRFHENAFSEADR